MPRTIAQRDLRNHNAEIIDAVSRGDSFIVTRNGEPVAELRPILGARHRIVPRADIIAAFAGAPRIDARQLRANLAGVVDQNIR
ncbi:MAG: type II toxin-antitoxin system Phd/YefM family antitoxin [Candidatus Dormibacteria bacterium]